MQNGFVSMLGNVKLLVTSIGTIIVCVILLIAANTMAMTARERVTEIAVLRTLGFPKRTILGLILGESLLLSLIGGLLGVGLFVLAFPGFRQGLLYSPMGGFAGGMQALPRGRRHGLRRRRSRRPPRRARAGGPVRPALDSRRPETGRLKGL